MTSHNRIKESMDFKRFENPCCRKLKSVFVLRVWLAAYQNHLTVSFQQRYVFRSFENLRNAFLKNVTHYWKHYGVLDHSQSVIYANRNIVSNPGFFTKQTIRQHWTCQFRPWKFSRVWCGYSVRCRRAIVCASHTSLNAVRVTCDVKWPKDGHADKNYSAHS